LDLLKKNLQSVDISIYIASSVFVIKREAKIKIRILYVFYVWDINNMKIWPENNLCNYFEFICIENFIYDA